MLQTAILYFTMLLGKNHYFLVFTEWQHLYKTLCEPIFQTWTLPGISWSMSPRISCHLYTGCWRSPVAAAICKYQCKYCARCQHLW